MSPKQSQPSFLHLHSVDVVAVAGLASLIVDAALGILRPSTLPRGLSLLLWLATGLALGNLELLFLASLRLALRFLSALLQPRHASLAAWLWPLAIGLVVAPISLAVGNQMFSGAGIRRMAISRVGPTLVVGLSVFAVMLLTRWFLAVLDGKRRRRLATALGALLAALVVLIIAAHVIPLNYGYLWDVATAVAFALVQAGLHLGRPAARIGRGRTLATAALLVLFAGSAVAVVCWPSSPVARAALHDLDHPSGRMASHWRHLIDFDGDGFSPVLGGGDCNDFNGAINPLALDVPADGIDQDCDGTDLTLAQAQARYGFWSRRPWAHLAQTSEKGVLSEPRPRTSVVLITIDALRADHARPIPGSLDELWGTSVRFDHAYAPSSSTRLSLPMLVTSRLAPTGGRHFAPTLAARLRGAGFRTAFVAYASPVNFLVAQVHEFHPPFDLKQGFDRVDLVPEGAIDSSMLGTGTSAAHDAATADRALRMSRDLARSTEPFFLWVHFFDPHQWEHVVQARPGEAAESRYRRAVAQTLKQTGRFLDGLKEIFPATPLVTVLSADHGEALGERDFHHHTRFLYDFLVRIPLLVRAPGLAPQTIHSPVSLLDVAPTILELAGVGRCADCSGDSLVPLVDATSAPPIRALLLRDNDQVALIRGGWKLLFLPRANLVELYPLDDERPADEASASHPAVAREMLGLLRTSPLRRFPPLRAR